MPAAETSVAESLRNQGPSHQYLTSYMILLFSGGVGWMVISKLLRPRRLREGLEQMGVSLRRMERSLKEMERKGFHLCGLLVPLIFQMLLHYGYTQTFCASVCWCVTVAGWSIDLLRVHTKWMRDAFPLKAILREEEKTQLSGGCFFSLGCTISISLFPPTIAMTSILFLVLGDMSAALIGVSFGGEKCSVRLGRDGKKSAEGSVAMFVVCCIVGFSVFPTVHLREYAVMTGALVATMVELFQPFGLDDNLTIPFFSASALYWAFNRISNCERGNPLDVLNEFPR